MYCGSPFVCVNAWVSSNSVCPIYFNGDVIV